MVSWSLDDQDQDSWNEIAQWWTALEGKQIRWIQDGGTINNLETGESRVIMRVTSGNSFNAGKPAFTIKNPTLQGISLSFEDMNGPRKLQVQRLELDKRNNELKVTCTDSTIHQFTDQPLTGITISSIPL